MVRKKGKDCKVLTEDTQYMNMSSSVQQQQRKK